MPEGVFALFSLFERKVIEQPFEGRRLDHPGHHPVGNAQVIFVAVRVLLKNPAVHFRAEMVYKRPSCSSGKILQGPTGLTRGPAGRAGDRHLGHIAQLHHCWQHRIDRTVFQEAGNDRVPEMRPPGLFPARIFLL